MISAVIMDLVSIVHNVNYLKQFILLLLFSGSVKARVLPGCQTGSSNYLEHHNVQLLTHFKPYINHSIIAFYTNMIITAKQGWI